MLASDPQREIKVNKCAYHPPTARSSHSSAMALLGEDGRGYELARRLESCGAWRAWLGDAAYSSFAHSLGSPAAWDAFFTPSSSSSSSGTRAQIQLQLRARALLFDKASAALFLDPFVAVAGTPIPNLNISYLQLHEDELYFSLEDEQHDGFQPQTPSRPAHSPHRPTQHSFERASSVGSRYNDPEHVNTSKHEDLPNKCYNQYVERYKAKRQKLPHGDHLESHKRTPDGMSLFSKLSDLHKKNRQLFKDPSKGIQEENCLIEEEDLFFPEIMFPANCVPDSALPFVTITEKKQKVEFFGVLDSLPTVISPSPAMMERFGIRPEYVKMGNKYRGKYGYEGDKRPLSQDQASQMAHKSVAHLLLSVGFEGASEVSMKVFSEFFSSYASKLGRKLKLLTDSYKKQVSAIELLKMFLQISGHGNLGALTEITKNANKGSIALHPQQVVRQTQSAPQQNALLQAQLFQRQMNPQMNMLHPQNIAFQQQQQQWEKLRRRQAATPRGSMMIMDKDSSLGDVKIENMVEGGPLMDTSALNATLNKQQMQLRQQQMSLASPSGEHFKQLQPIQIPQLQAQMVQNAFNMRSGPVKAEAFHELMHEPVDQNKLLSSPPSK